MRKYHPGRSKSDFHPKPLAREETSLPLGEIKAEAAQRTASCLASLRERRAD